MINLKAGGVETITPDAVEAEVGAAEVEGGVEIVEAEAEVNAVEVEVEAEIDIGMREVINITIEEEEVPVLTNLADKNDQSHPQTTENIRRSPQHKKDQKSEKPNPPVQHTLNPSAFVPSHPQIK